MVGRQPHSIFQSTLPRGERPVRHAGFGCVVEFQSTLPRGERRWRVGMGLGRRQFQSTLPRGERPATKPTSCCAGAYFNPRSRVGSDAQKKIHQHYYNRFQSTLPRGERQKKYPEISKSLKFQSTLPRGERHISKQSRVENRKISIHAPAWGATFTVAFLHLNSRNFNPRSRVGSDLATILITNMVGHFNPRSRVGSDSCSWLFSEYT